MKDITLVLEINYTPHIDMMKLFRLAININGLYEFNDFSFYTRLCIAILFWMCIAILDIFYLNPFAIW